MVDRRAPFEACDDGAAGGPGVHFQGRPGSSLARRTIELASAHGIPGWGASHFSLVGAWHEQGEGKDIALAKQYYRRALKQHDASATSGMPTEKFIKKELERRLDAIKHTCAACNKLGDNLKLCSRCKGPRYCGVTCQRKDWADHKHVCQKASTTQN